MVKKGGRLDRMYTEIARGKITKADIDKAEKVERQRRADQAKAIKENKARLEQEAADARATRAAARDARRNS